MTDKNALTVAITDTDKEPLVLGTAITGQGILINTPYVGELRILKAGGSLTAPMTVINAVAFTYTVIEVADASGTAKTGATGTILSYGSGTHTAVFLNRRRVTVELTLKDKRDSTILLQNAEYLLYKLNDDDTNYEPVLDASLQKVSMKTGSNGVAKITLDNAGDYLLLENKSPSGYEMPDYSKSLEFWNPTTSAYHESSSKATVEGNPSYFGHLRVPVTETELVMPNDTTRVIKKLTDTNVKLRSLRVSKYEYTRTRN